MIRYGTIYVRCCRPRWAMMCLQDEMLVPDRVVDERDQVAHVSLVGLVEFQHAVAVLQGHCRSVMDDKRRDSAIQQCPTLQLLRLDDLHEPDHQGAPDELAGHPIVERRLVALLVEIVRVRCEQRRVAHHLLQLLDVWKSERRCRQWPTADGPVAMLTIYRRAVACCQRQQLTSLLRCRIRFGGLRALRRLDGAADHWLFVA